MTQSDLAVRSGFSDRLIRKAEAGLPISADTVAALAQSLSTKKDILFAEDLVVDPIAIARQYVESVYRYGPKWVEKMRPLLRPDLVFRFVGDPGQIPFAGEHVGLEAVADAFEIFSRCSSRRKITIPYRTIGSSGAAMKSS